jgi:hypothetical protein
VASLSESQELSGLVVELLDDRSAAVINAAAQALARSRTPHRIRVEPIVRILREAVRRRPEIDSKPLLELLELHCDDAEAELRDGLSAETDQDELADLLIQLGNLRAGVETAANPKGGAGNGE